MAKISFGFGTAHGPLLSTPPDKWYLRGDADRQNPAHPFRGKTYNFEELYELRKAENFAAQNTQEVRAERHARCQTQIKHLSERIEEQDPDVILIVGDDQREWFLDDVQPTFTVYYGEEVVNAAYDEEKACSLPPGLTYSLKATHPEEDQTYPCESGLALKIIEQAVEEEFDIATSKSPPVGEKGPRGIGHAFGYIYRQLLNDKPRPLVPILINTFFPPNQATPKRCYEFGQMIGRAIENWDSDKKIAICASGGLSHFVIDEDFDGRILSAMQAGDVEALISEPNDLFRSGTSETKNWIVVCGILSQTGFKMNVLDYVPCYRSDAGTGNAMAFATWE
jgi:aromatic ring-opening dioxygenase LigB subunit